MVTVQAYDASSNGTTNGPIHTASEPLRIYFQAGDQISALTLDPNQAAISFAAKLGTDYYLEATPDLSETNGWQTVSGPISGNNHFQIFTEANQNAAQCFYRLRLMPTP